MANRYKAYGQQSVFDEMFSQKVRHNRTTLLQEIGDYLDFEIFRANLERVFKSKQYGPCRFDVVLLFKVTMLQKWYDLSDPRSRSPDFRQNQFSPIFGVVLNG
jgi:hypothetical protein